MHLEKWWKLHSFTLWMDKAFHAHLLCMRIGVNFIHFNSTFWKFLSCKLYLTVWIILLTAQFVKLLFSQEYYFCSLLCSRFLLEHFLKWTLFLTVALWLTSIFGRFFLSVLTFYYNPLNCVLVAISFLDLTCIFLGLAQQHVINYQNTCRLLYT